MNAAETERQIRVMQDSLKPGAVRYRRFWANSHGHWDSCGIDDRWNWAAYDYKVEFPPQPWEDELWVKSQSVMHSPFGCTDDELIKAGWRKIRVREVVE